MPRIRLENLSQASETLLLPLYFRAAETQRPDGIIQDPKAVELVNSLDYEFPGFDKLTFTQITAIMRARQFDRYTQEFLSTQPDGSVVDIGCGLDTRFHRLDNGTAEWYALDLPEVMALRRQLLSETERYHFISSSALDFTWMDRLSNTDGHSCLFLAEGVLPYLKESEVQGLVTTLRQRFPGAELVFDALPPFQVAMGRLHPALRKTSARLYWGLRNTRALEGWGDVIRLLNEWFYFEQPEPRLRALRLLRFFPPVGKGFKILRYRLGVSAHPGTIRRRKCGRQVN
jgi:O-methyltransferase involved in polyketide biosynthesis